MDDEHGQKQMRRLYCLQPNWNVENLHPLPTRKVHDLIDLNGSSVILRLHPDCFHHRHRLHHLLVFFDDLRRTER